MVKGPRATLVSILALAVALSSAGCTAAAPPATSQLYFSDLRTLIEQQDVGGIVQAKAAWEPSWTDAWKLESAKEEWIDHGRMGLVLVWQRRVGKDVRVRTDTLSLDGQFLWAYERLLRDGAEVARGSVYLSPDGQLRYREMRVLTGEPMPDQSWRYGSDVIGQLEVIADGKVISVYQSQRGFGVKYFVERRTGHLYVPADTVLVSGVEAPEVRRRKR